MSNNEIVQKLWNLCDVLRDDGINYTDYVTELVLLLFIKMEHENARAASCPSTSCPRAPLAGHLPGSTALNLLNHYKQTLLGPLAERRPAHRRHLRRRTDPPERAAPPGAADQSLDGIDWYSAQRDGLGDLYEGLLEKNATKPNPVPANTSRRGR